MKTGSQPRNAAFIRYLPLHFAEHADLDANGASGLCLVHAAGRASRIRLPRTWFVAVLPLSGHARLESDDGEWMLQRGKVQAWRDGDLQVESRAGTWLALAGRQEAWQPHLRTALPLRGGSCLFPHESNCSRELRRLFVHLARVVRRTTLGDAHLLVEAICTSLAEHQQDLLPRLQRCSGRTLQRRRQTLLRLLRVRHLVEVHRDGRPDLHRLSRSANYSPWHLIRMFREVFGETPTEYASRLRLQRAWALVEDTRMPVCEISEALGFESQSSFCRAFKNAYGTTTGQVRRHREHGDDARAA